VSEGNQTLNEGQTLFPEKAPDLFTGMVFTEGLLPPPSNPCFTYPIWVNLRGGTDSQEKFPAEKSHTPELILKSQLKILGNFSNNLEIDMN
jgi:hypothetical protein